MDNRQKVDNGNGPGQAGNGAAKQSFPAREIDQWG
jgi:hypothetical protein